MSRKTSSSVLPKLRFKAFKSEGGWPLTTLSEVLREHGLKSDGTSEVHSVSLSKGIVPQVEHLGRSFAASDTARYGLVRPFDVVYTRSPLADFRLGIVKQHKSDQNAIVSPLYGVFEPRNRYLGLLIEAFFESPARAFRYLDPLAQKGARNTIQLSNERFLSGSLYLPESDREQQEVAECLSSLDELIAAEGRKLEALRQHKQGLMAQLFPQAGRTTPRLRFPAFQYSPGWKACNCRDIAEVLPGYGFPRKFQGNKNGQYPFYKVSDISRAVESGQRHISEATNYIDSDVLEEIRARPVPAGTTIFAKIGEAIRLNRRAVTTMPSVVDNNMAGVKAIGTKVSDEFLFYLWSTVSLIDHAGGVVPAVSKSALESVPLCYPSDPEEQRRIADCLSAIDLRISAQLAKFDILWTHKRGMMQQLFPRWASGKP